MSSSQVSRVRLGVRGPRGIGAPGCPEVLLSMCSGVVHEGSGVPKGQGDRRRAEDEVTVVRRLLILSK